MKHEIEPIADYGDIVSVVGYGDHLFAVESYTIEYHHEPGYEFCELLYDLTCVYGDSGYIIGEQTDVVVVCKSYESEAFLRDYQPKAKTTLSKLTVNLSISEDGTVVATNPKPPTNRRKQALKQAEIDGLLDELSDLLTLNAFFGGKDFEYAERIARVTGKLKEVSGG